MGIVGTNEMNGIATHALITHPDVSLDMLQHVTEVNGAVCVRQGTGNQNFTSCSGHSSCLYEEKKRGYVTEKGFRCLDFRKGAYLAGIACYPGALFL